MIFLILLETFVRKDAVKGFEYTFVHKLCGKWIFDIIIFKVC